MEKSYIELEKAFSQLILSASGWRKVFACSGCESDSTTEISSVDADIVYLAAYSFAEFLQTHHVEITKIIVGMDSRPTGQALKQEALCAFCATGCPLTVCSAGIVAAPEIMCFAHSEEAAFMYISASHNPIGHNGIKFGLASGGVLNPAESALLITAFTEKCHAASSEAIRLIRQKTDMGKLEQSIRGEAETKQAALAAYRRFLKTVIADSSDSCVQERFFTQIQQQCTALKNKGTPFTLVADFNGSARALSVDRRFFERLDMRFIGIAEQAGTIAHGIVPEGDNLRTCIEALEAVHRENPATAENAVFGYMPDCDGDRGNIIYWNDTEKKALPLDAQAVFALSVMAELSFLHYRGSIEQPLAVAVNGATSLRISSIADALGAKVFCGEVGEANIVNRARDLRKQGYTVRIFGEGSNGGNITHPAAVRDPLNTLFAIIKLLLIKDTPEQKCPFRIWCEKSNQAEKYRSDFTLADIIRTLPVYTTTATQETRAILKISTASHAALKKAYQAVFEREWQEKRAVLKERFGICSYQVYAYNGTVCTENLNDFGLSGTGGLKIQFYDVQHTAVAFVWMRGSGTEPIFRVMADIKGHNPDAEMFLVEWQGRMVKQADTAAQSHN
ncbi:MAG: phosphoglucomutase [Treponema sp.]